MPISPSSLCASASLFSLASTGSTNFAFSDSANFVFFVAPGVGVPGAERFASLLEINDHQLIRRTTRQASCVPCKRYICRSAVQDCDKEASGVLQVRVNTHTGKNLVFFNSEWKIYTDSAPTFQIEFFSIIGWPMRCRKLRLSCSILESREVT